MKKQTKRRANAAKKSIITISLLAIALIAIPFGLKAAVFNSAADPGVFPMLDGFSTLPQSTLDENDAKVIAINNGASQAEQTAAIQAADYPFSRMNLSNTKYLGGVRDAYLDADAAGEVPLVNQLLAQGHYNDATHMNLDGQSEWASSDNAKDRYNYQRPICRIGGNINNYSNHPCPSKSFPSGHSRISFLEGVSLAVMLPEVAPQIMARSTEIANYRVVLGVHYPLDIMGGRALATRMVAYRLHDDTWKAKFDAAKTQLRNAIEARCGMTIAACYATKPTSNDGASLSTANALTAERDKLTYGFTRIGTAGQSFSAPDYSYELLTAAFPSKTQSELNTILTSTAIDSGYPLDTTGTSAGSANIGWTRLDIAKALTTVDSGTPPTDTTAPTTSITAPTNGATVSGTVAITATATDNTGVTEVEFSISNGSSGSTVTDTTAPYAHSWDTTGSANGTYNIDVRARDAAGNWSTTSHITVTVNNVASGDATAPTVSLTSPTSGATVSGSQTLTATASDNVAVTLVEFYVDGALVGADSTSPYTTSWDSSSTGNGTHTITAKAYDAANNSKTSAPVNVSVANGSTNPSGTPLVFDLPGVSPGTDPVDFSIEGTCSNSLRNPAVAAVPNQLKDHTILAGAQFTVTCASAGGDASVALHLSKAYAAGTLKVFKQAGATLEDITSHAVIATETISGGSVTVIRYNLSDGGFGDEDGVANSEIADPVFVTFQGSPSDISGGVPTTPQTGIKLPLNSPVVVIIGGIVAAVLLVAIGRKLARR